MNELLTILRPDEAYFWGTHAGAEAMSEIPVI